MGEPELNHAPPRVAARDGAAGARDRSVVQLASDQEQEEQAETR